MRASAESPTRRRFGQIVARDEAQLDLAEAALLIAAEEYPDLNVGRYLLRLDEMGARAREAVPEQEALSVRLSALNRYLFAQEGFRGNAAEYYDPRNSFLNDRADRTARQYERDLSFEETQPQRPTLVAVRQFAQAAGTRGHDVDKPGIV